MQKTNILLSKSVISTEAEYSNHLENIKKNIKAEPYSRPVKAASRVGLRIRLFKAPLVILTCGQC